MVLVMEGVQQYLETSMRFMCGGRFAGRNTPVSSCLEEHPTSRQELFRAPKNFAVYKHQTNMLYF